MKQKLSMLISEYNLNLTPYFLVNCCSYQCVNDRKEAEETMALHETEYQRFIVFIFFQEGSINSAWHQENLKSVRFFELHPSTVSSTSANSHT